MWTTSNDQDPTKTDVRGTDIDTGDQVVIRTFDTEEQAWTWLRENS